MPETSVAAGAGSSTPAATGCAPASPSMLAEQSRVRAAAAALVDELGAAGREDRAADLRRLMLKAASDPALACATWRALAAELDAQARPA